MKYIFILRDPRAIVNSLKNVKHNAIKLNLPIPRMSRNLYERIKTVQEHHREGFKAVAKNKNIMVI